MNEIVSTLDFGQLPRVTEVFRVTASVLREDDPARAGVLNNLGSAAQLTHLRSGDLVDLEDAISYYRSASATAHADDQDLVLYRCNLVLALGEYAGKAGDVGTAAEGIRVARETVERTPRRDHRRAMTLIRLANALKLHARLADDADSDGESIEVFREAARISPAREAATSELLINLGAALLRRYERDGSAEDLDEGIKHLGSGAGALADGEPRRSALCHLANALRLRFRHSGSLSDLNASVNEMIGLLGVLEPGHQLTGRTAWILAATAIEHVDATGEPSQLRRVLHPLAPAIRSMAGTDAERSLALAGYGAMLRRHFVHGSEQAALDAGVRACQAATEAPGPADKAAAVRNSLVTALIDRYEHTGDTGDLDQAADLAHAVSQAAGEGSADGYTARAQLGLIAMHRFRLRDGQSDLERAVELFDAVLAEIPDQIPSRAAVATNLGRALQALHQRTGRRRYYRWARKVLTEAAEQTTAPAEQRLRAANLSGRLAAEASRWGEAVESFRSALKLLPLISCGKRVVATPATQRRWATITADAVAAALEAGEPVRAMEMLEFGRSAILSDFLPAGGELGELHRTHPDLADEAVQLRRLLNRPADEPVLGEPDDRGRLARSWERLLEEIRAERPSHLRPRRLRELAEGAPDGTVVMINLSRYRSDALVLVGGRVVTVPLPNTSPERAAERSAALLAAAQQDDHRTADSVLDWTWQHIARPVLERMGYLGVPGGGVRWPRVWWSAMGETAFLPLHAAQARTGECVLERVVSSYTPTLGALLRARERPMPDSGAALVAAGSAQQIGRELPRQNQVLAQYWPQAEIKSVEAATAPDVLRDLPRHPWLHVCEPSSQFPAQPAAGVLLERDAPQRSLGLVELGQVPLEDAEFAYLGQCATAADETSPAGISLAGALSFAGFAHALGTLWEVDEHSAVRVPAGLYETTYHDGEFDTARTAFALHHVTRALRNEAPEASCAWAAHVHAGP
ncbi:CHAT domain-containing protein [Saccharopolyspora sp. HNM0983]|uniref:CHAT domain-containing protein n=2 Tax=Saccharopolyspora montiporae TaxID=2781240 RepID=A0A929FZV1_9PSEU|nr:CHAT domain-containing protein [Saccharopolyspora sp. HNM0983]